MVCGLSERLAFTQLFMPFQVLAASRPQSTIAVSMTTARSLIFPHRSQRGNATTSILVTLAIIGVAAAAFLFFSQGNPLHTAPIAKVAPTPVPEAAPAPAPAPAATPAPVATEKPVATPEPAVVAKPSEITPDIETIARTPAWWPKSVNLTQALTIPVFINGKPSGQAQLPAQTAVQLVRVTGPQLEIEYLNQHLMVPPTATDVIARATELARAAAHAPSPAQQAAPVPKLSAVAATASAMSSPSPQKLGVAEPGRYRKEALEVMDDIQQRFWIPQSLRYAKKSGSKDADTVWGAGVMFSALVGAARQDPGKYKPLLGKFFEGLNGYWDTKAPVPGYEPAPTSGNGHDKYYDDNAWLVITFFEAYELTHFPQYRKRADETLEFVLSGWDDTVLDGGIWWHESHEKKGKGKNTCANAPSAVACLLSAKYAQPQAAKNRLEWARKIAQWTKSNLQLENGLFADSKGANGDQNRAQLTYNSALMLRAFLGLYRVTKDPKDLAEAQRIGKAGESFMDNNKGAFRDSPKWAHLMVEADLELYRTTHEEYLLTRARKNADHYYETWKSNPPDDLITIASYARTLFLLADTESDIGRKFWETADLERGR